VGTLVVAFRRGFFLETIPAAEKSGPLGNGTKKRGKKGNIRKSQVKRRKKGCNSGQESEIRPKKKGPAHKER